MHHSREMRRFVVEAPSSRRGNRKRSSATAFETMTTLEQYQLVRIKTLLQSPNEYDGWRLNKRPPWVGDIGTLLEPLHADGLPDRYVVECSETNGTTVWLSDFHRDELEPLTDIESTIPDRAHLIFRRSGSLVLIKRPDVDWRVLQDMYPDYMASLGPWNADEIASYFADDYTDESRWPFSRTEMGEFFGSSGRELSKE